MSDRRSPQTTVHEIDCGSDDHVCVIVRREGHRTVSLDLSNRHGRAHLSVRSNGMGIGGLLTDQADDAPISDSIDRYCPECGAMINLVSSKGHVCPEAVRL